MTCRHVGLSTLAILIAIAAFSLPAAEPPSNSSRSQRGEPRLSQFRGVTPGQTTETALLNDPQWGKPASRESLRGDVTLLRYPVSKFAVVVAVRDGVVRSLDVLFPAGATVDEAVTVFDLKDPLPEGPLPPAALVGEWIPEGLKARQFGSRRVVLFVEQSAERPLAKRARFYGLPDRTRSVYRNVTYGFQMKLPDIAPISKQQAGFLRFRTPHQAGETPWTEVRVAVFDPPQGETFEGLKSKKEASTARAKILENEGFQIEEIAQSFKSIAGSSALVVDRNVVSPDGRKLRDRQYVRVGNGRLFVVTCVAPQQDWSRYAHTFERCVEDWPAGEAALSAHPLPSRPFLRDAIRQFCFHPPQFAAGDSGTTHWVLLWQSGPKSEKTVYARLTVFQYQWTIDETRSRMRKVVEQKGTLNNEEEWTVSGMPALFRDWTVKETGIRVMELSVVDAAQIYTYVIEGPPDRIAAHQRELRRCIDSFTLTR